MIKEQVQTKLARDTFDSSTNVEDLIVTLESSLNLKDQCIEKIFDKFNRFGAVILQHEEPQKAREILIELGNYFGSVVGHDRADIDGVTTIANLKGFDGYLGASYTDHPLHTGGVYSDNPPAIILLQCIKQSSTGGDTILVSSKKIYDYLTEHDPKGLSQLKKQGSVSIKRGNAEASRPIFDRDFLGNGSYMFSFRCDDVIRFEVNPANLITTLAKIKLFIDVPKNQIKFRLKENQILIADNTAVMHARTAFPADEERTLLRLTLDGKPEDIKHPLILGFK